MSRLDEIKLDVGYKGAEELYVLWRDCLDSEDLKWIIRQAERVEELEEFYNEMLEEAAALSDQNQRYKQALEFYAKRMHYSLAYWATGNEENVLDYGEVARQALEKEAD